MPIKVTQIKPDYSDERGDIYKLVDNHPEIRSVLRISHKKGTAARGNHFHKKDTHWVFVEKGKMRYSERDATSATAEVESVILGPGDMVVSKAGRAHAMEALENTVFWAITTEGRKQANYEEDTVRVKIV